MKIVVDTNVVFSGILKSTSKIGKILINSRPHFQFYSCDFLRTEIQKHRSKLLKFTKLQELELVELETLVTKNITFVNEGLLPPALIQSTEILLKDIDQNDTPFVALARHIEAKLKNLLQARNLKGEARHTDFDLKPYLRKRSSPSL